MHLREARVPALCTFRSSSQKGCVGMSESAPEVRYTRQRWQANAHVLACGLGDRCAACEQLFAKVEGKSRLPNPKDVRAFALDSIQCLCRIADGRVCMGLVGSTQVSVQGAWLRAVKDTQIASVDGVSRATYRGAGTYLGFALCERTASASNKLLVDSLPSA